MVFKELEKTLVDRAVFTLSQVGTKAQIRVTGTGGRRRTFSIVIGVHANVKAIGIRAVERIGMAFTGFVHDDDRLRSTHDCPTRQPCLKNSVDF